MLRSIFAFTALLVTAGANAQTNVTVEAATNVFNQVLGVSFAPPSTKLLNTDSASLHRLESLTFVTNPSTFFVDLLAADNGGNVLLYATDFTCPPPQACTTGTVVSQAAAIGNPNGLSADPFGNVFAVNNAPGSSPQPQVWALPTDGNGGYKAAVLIDTTNPPGSFGQHQSVVETLSIRTPLGPLLHTGDLLVVSQNPDEILLYPANAVSQLLQSGSGPPIPPQTLIPTCPVQAPACIPAGSTPGGIAVWPADNSLLVTTFGGQILRFGTATGVITSMNPVMGLPAGNLYKINAGLANGGPVAYVALSAPGNHGSILQLVPAGNAIQFQTSVTAPGSVQGVAVTNTVQAPESNCLAANNGCDLFGDVLNKHTVKPIPGGAKLASTNIVESVCLVPQDPRVSFIGGAWTCNGNPLPVNQVCPGFDNTNGVNPMTIPGYACGASGSNNTAFALIKTLTGPDQFNATYIETEQDPNALFSGATNPVCGPIGTFVGVGVWAPLAGETLLVEENVNIVNPGNANPTPTLVDATEGCGSGKTGTPQVSVFSSGLALSLGGNAGNTQAQLETFVQQKYTNLLTTISELSSGANPNVSAAVASQLTNANQTGCVDVSLSLFTKAMGEANGSPQQTADFQDAADLLTNADKNNNTTCDSIVTNNAYVAGAFHETLPPATPVYNPSGQLRWRFANTSNAITMRILGQMPASTWPTPVSLSASAQYLFAKCVPPGCPPQQNPSTATLSWALVSGASCGWNSNDSYFMAHQPNLANSHAIVGPFTDPGTGTTYTYTLNCTGLPVGTMPGGGTTMSVSTNVTVWPAVVVTPSAQSVVANNSVQVNWTPPAGATACTLAFSGQGSWNSGSKTFLPGPATSPPATYAASYQAVSKDVSKGVTFYATCTAGASAGVKSITVTHH
jgi:hypothetical protein